MFIMAGMESHRVAMTCVCVCVWLAMSCWWYDVLCGVGDMVSYVVLAIWSAEWCWWYGVLCGVGDMTFCNPSIAFASRTTRMTRTSRSSLPIA